MQKIVMAIFLITYFLISNAIYAGGVIKIQETDSSKGDIKISTIYLTPEFLRIDFTTKAGDNFLIYDSAKELVWSIDKQNKTYMEITKAEILKLKEMFGNKEIIHENITRGMTEEKKQEFEKQLAEKQNDNKIEYKKLPSKIKLNEWNCDKYDGYRDSLLVSEIWAADFKSCGVKTEYNAILKTAADIFINFSKKIGKSTGLNYLEIVGDQNFPVKSITYNKKGAKQTTEVKEILEKEIPSNMFQLPEGLTKAEFPLNEKKSKR